MRPLSFDTPFDPDFPVYTRANAGEILPHVLTPLAWTVAGPAFEEGFRIAFADDCGAVPRPGADRPWQMVGRFGGRFHLNLSVIRTVGERLPGTSAAAVDSQYMGDAGVTGLPEHERHADDRKFRLKAAPSMARTMAGMGRRVARDGDAVAEYLVGVDELLATSPSAAAIVRRVRVGTALFGRLVGTHVTARALTSPVLEQATNAVARAGVAPEDSLRYVASIPDLESAKPSRALAAIAATVIGNAELEALTRGGSLDAIRAAAGSTEGADALATALDEFLAAYGHRGVGEYDPTLPVWEQRPDQVVTLLGRLLADRHGLADDHLDPGLDESLSDDGAPDPGRIARQVVAAARSAMHRAERTKDHAIRATGGIRRLLFALPAVLDVDLDELRLLTIDEVEALANGGTGPSPDERKRRADDLVTAEATELAEWSNGEIRTMSTNDEVPMDADTEILTGIAGSPGVAEGRARVLTDPFGAFDDGDILIVHMTDTAWTPLFLAAAGVVTDVGGVLSHATIVARELGIPAVVNTKIGTTAIHDGDTVRVDGGTGTVTVIDRS